MWAKARISGGADFCGSGACSTLPARRGPMHALHEPFARSRDVDQDAIADARVWQSVGLFQPAPDCARMAVCVSGKWLEIDEIVEKIRVGHWCTVLAYGVTVHDNLHMARD
jgi:hypothetical protein